MLYKATISYPLGNHIYYIHDNITQPHRLFTVSWSTHCENPEQRRAEYIINNEKLKTETENLTLCGKHHWKLESVSENTLFLMLDAS